MSRVQTCDFCNMSIEWKDQSTPIGWQKIKLDMRTSRNIGGCAWNFDVCDKCESVTQYLTNKEKAITLLKTLSKAQE